MKYTNEITINLPIDRVIELFDSIDNMKKWMPGLVSAENISGDPGRVGAKMKLTFKRDKNREMVLTETITVRNLPHEFSGIYEHAGVYNEVRNYFTAIDDTTTLYRTETVFEFSSIPMKLLGWLMPGAFKKQSQKYLQLFKEFAEKEG